MTLLANRPARAKTRTPRKVSTVRFGLAPFEDDPGIIDITVDGKKASYFLSRVPSDFGEAFSLEKFTTHGNEEQEVYHVLLEQDGFQCECKGHLRWGHQTRCKHIGAILKLKELGKL
jgi:hypothetical protein